MRKIGIAVGVILALIIIALLIVPTLVNVNQYRGKLEAELQKQLGRPVTLGELHLHLLPPSIRVDSFSIGEDPAFGNGKFATAQQLYISPKLLPLLRKEIQISSLELKSPVIELIRNSQGTWNYSTLGKSPQPLQPQAPAGQSAQQQPSPTRPSPPAQPQPGEKFELDRLAISDGTIAITDRQKKQNRAVYDHIDASLKNYAPNKPFSFMVAAHLPGKGTQTVQLTGNAGPINQNNSLQTPFSGTLKLNEVQLSGIQKYLNSPSLENTDAIVSGTTDINNEQGKLSSRGTLSLTNPRIRGVDIGYPINADYRLTDDLSNDLITIDKGDIKLGSTPLSVSGTMNSKPTPAQVDMHLKASDVSIGDAARLASAFGVAFNPKTKVAGRVNADIQARGPATQPAMNGTLSARDLVVSGGDIPEPVKVQSLDLSLTPQQIRSNPFTAISGSTNLAVQFTMANYTTPSPALDATLRAANAQISELLGMARAYGVTAADGLTGSGSLNLDVHVAGPLKDPNAMNFNGTGTVANASLKPPTFTQPLNVKNAAIRFSSNSAVLTNLAASLGSSDASGNMTVRNFAAPNLQFTLNSSKVNVTELQQITSGAPSNPPANQHASAGWSLVQAARAQTPARQAPAPGTPSLISKMTGNGNLAVGTLLNDQLVLNNVRSSVVINRGIVTLSPINASLYGGQATGQITANLLTTPMQVLVNTKLGNVSANELVSSVSSLKNTIYGLLAANTNLRFNAASSADVARSLNGSLALNLNNGKIAKIDLINQLAAIGKFVGLRKSATAMTNVAKLSGNFNIVNGLAQTNNLQAAIDGGTLAAAGTINLATQALDLRLTTVLDKNVSQQAGGNSVGGIMQTALQNNKGELVMPILVTGTFDNPHFAPDVQAIGEMKLKNALPSLTNPGGAGGILGSILKGGGTQGGQPSPQGDLNGAIGGILGSISGQQKQPRQAPAPQPRNPGTAQQQQQQEQQPNVTDLLNSVLGGKKKKQQQPPPQPPPQ